MYIGGEATNSDWEMWRGGWSGGNLTKIAGSPTLNDGSPCLGEDDDSVFLDGSTYYQAAGTTFGNFAEYDIMLFGLVKGCSGTGRVMWKQNGNDEVYFSSLYFR